MLMARVPVCVPHRLAIACVFALGTALLSGRVCAAQAPSEADTSASYRKLITESERRDEPPAKRGYLWAMLASSYHDKGNVAEAFRAYDRALPLLAKDADARANYATALDNLGSLYLETGRIPEAETTRTRALHLREELGNAIDLARSHEHLAEIHLARHHYPQAEAEARAAHDIFLTSPEPERYDAAGNSHPGNTLLSSLVTLVFAECAQSKWDACHQSAVDADKLVQQDFAPDSLERAHTEMALGFAQWKTGDPSAAEKSLQSGMAIMKARLGETSPIVLDSMYEYRDFLASQHRKPELRQLDQSIRIAVARQQSGICNNCQVSAFALR